MSRVYIRVSRVLRLCTFSRDNKTKSQDHLPSNEVIYLYMTPSLVVDLKHEVPTCSPFLKFVGGVLCSATKSKHIAILHLNYFLEIALWLPPSAADLIYAALSRQIDGVTGQFALLFLQPSGL